MRCWSASLNVPNLSNRMQRMCRLVCQLERSRSSFVIKIWFAGKRTLKNMVGQVDENIEQFRTNLIRLRDNFLTRAAVTTEVAVLGAGA
jgi:hypothetical protein